MLLLAGRFLEQNRARLGLRNLRLSAAAQAALHSYHWPGNIRELEHVISRAALKTLSRGASRHAIVTLEPEVLDLDALQGAGTLPTAAAPLSPTALPEAAPAARTLREAIDTCQRQSIQSAWSSTGATGPTRRAS